MHRVHDMPFGAAVLDDGSVRFRLWAPDQPSVTLEVADGEPHLMHALPDGWHETVLPAADVPAGTRYRYRFADGLAAPDPASRFNPDDVHGSSVVVDPRSHPWTDGDWRGRPWHEAVVYELHVGSFTDEGTFDAAAQRLPALAALGITAVELMPVADFPGQRGWGYDGVLHYAPEGAYGSPDALKRLVQEAHRLGLMVLLDVVYNHFGPDGNYLHAWCPSFFDPAHTTPWGAGIAFGARTVREFFVHNALYWVEEFHFDGLRLDAVHAMGDRSPEHIAREIARRLRDGPGREREVHVVLENDANQATLLGPDGARAQWNDDWHHAAHAMATGERDGYYADYADAPLERLGRSLAEGYAYQGEASAFRGGEPRGEPSAALHPTSFVSSLQTHDQVGNRAMGERIGRLAEPMVVDALYACLLLSPHVPMLFMGEEFDASSPFLYFCDFHDDLARAVREGRRNEFARFAAFSDPAARERIPDPNAPGTFLESKLRWHERDAGAHAQRLELVRELLSLRRQHLVPRLGGPMQGGRHAVSAHTLQVQWTLADGARWHLLAHFAPTGGPVTDTPPGRTVYRRGIDDGMAQRAGVWVTLDE
jgi:maltooligosyltrehalose trehalohydrolase